MNLATQINVMNPAIYPQITRHFFFFEMVLKTMYFLPVPKHVLSDLNCKDESGTIQCKVTSTGSCEDDGGPDLLFSWSLQGGQACNISLISTQKSTDHQLGNTSIVFNDILPFSTYNISVAVLNEIGQTSPLTTKVSTSFIIYSTSEGPLQLQYVFNGLLCLIYINDLQYIIKFNILIEHSLRAYFNIFIFIYLGNCILHVEYL